MKKILKKSKRIIFFIVNRIYEFLNIDEIEKQKKVENTYLMIYINVFVLIF